MEKLTHRIGGGVKICLPRSVICLSTFVALEQEDWFEDEISFVRALSTQGLNAIDIGANFGFYTLALAKNSESVVWAFEPTAQPHAYLTASLAENRNSNVKVIKTALSDFTGTTTFTLGWTPEMNAMNKDLNGSVGSENAPVNTLDQAAEEYGIENVDFIKIDAEGQELAILGKAGRFFDVNSPLAMFEIKDQDAQVFDAAQWFLDNGFNLYRLVPGLNVLIPYTRGEPLDSFCLNLFACRKDRSRQLSERGLLVQHSEECEAPEDQTDPYDAHARAHEPGRPPAERWAMLEAAYSILSRRHAENPADLGILAAAARLANETGRRREAVGLARHAFEKHMNGISADEAVLPATVRYDGNGTDSNRLIWLRASLMELYLIRSAYSAYYVGQPYFDKLASLRETPYWSAPMERRRQLLGMKLGTEKHFSAHPLLMEEGPENRNPGFWSK